jgi:NitT/TauT family transport system substrate-binding protein
LPAVIFSFPNQYDVNNMKEIAKVRKQRKTTTIIAALLSATIMLLPTLTATTTQHIAAQEQASAQEVKTLRIGYFPNINHAQAVIGLGK